MDEDDRKNCAGELGHCGDRFCEFSLAKLMQVLIPSLNLQNLRKIPIFEPCFLRLDRICLWFHLSSAQL